MKYKKVIIYLLIISIVIQENFYKIPAVDVEPNEYVYQGLIDYKDIPKDSWEMVRYEEAIEYYSDLPSCSCDWIPRKNRMNINPKHPYKKQWKYFWLDDNQNKKKWDEEWNQYQSCGFARSELSTGYHRITLEDEDGVYYYIYLKIYEEAFQPIEPRFVEITTGKQDNGKYWYQVQVNLGTNRFSRVQYVHIFYDNQLVESYDVFGEEIDQLGEPRPIPRKYNETTSLTNVPPGTHTVKVTVEWEEMESEGLLFIIEEGTEQLQISTEDYPLHFPGEDVTDTTVEHTVTEHQTTQQNGTTEETQTTERETTAEVETSVALETVENTTEEKTKKDVSETIPFEISTTQSDALETTKIVKTKKTEVGTEIKRTQTVRRIKKILKWKVKEKRYNQIQISWNSLKGQKACKIYRALRKKGKYQYVGKTKKNVFVDKKRTPGKQYYYRIKVKLADNSELSSSPKKIYLKGKPDRPKLKIQINYGYWTVYWGIFKDNSQGLDVYMKIGLGKYKKIRTITKLKKNRVKKGVTGIRSSVAVTKKGILYQFKVRSFAKVRGKKVYGKWSKVAKYKRRSS